MGAAERDEHQRHAFRDHLTAQATAEFVIVDESSTNLNLTPRYARAPRSQRANGSVPRNTPPTTTVIAAMSRHGMGPALTILGATDRAAVAVYVEQVCGPSVVAG